jgi:hypothetical protein
MLGARIARASLRPRHPNPWPGFLAANGARVPPRAAPLRTHPAVDVARGSEGGLPNGFVSLDFRWGPLNWVRLAGSYLGCLVPGLWATARTALCAQPGRRCPACAGAA